VKPLIGNEKRLCGDGAEHIVAPGQFSLLTLPRKRSLKRARVGELGINKGKCVPKSTEMKEL